MTSHLSTRSPRCGINKPLLIALGVVQIGCGVPRNPPSVVDDVVDEPQQARLELRIADVVEIGDSIWFTVGMVTCPAGRRFCRVQPIAEIPQDAWTIDPSDNIDVLHEDLVARRIGPTVAHLKLRGQSVTASTTVIPRVAQFRWEPQVRGAFVRDTIRLQAIARDEFGMIVAIRPAARMSGSASPATHLIYGGVRGTLAIPHAPGVLNLVAELGHHRAQRSRSRSKSVADAILGTFGPEQCAV